MKKLVIIFACILIAASVGFFLTYGKDIQDSTQETVRRLIAETYKVNKSNVTTTGVFTEGFNFARGEYTLQSGERGIFLAAETSGEWRLAYAGKGPPLCEIVEPYGFPSAMLEDCVSMGEALSAPFGPEATGRQ